jgi:hypothetical protein
LRGDLPFVDPGASGRRLDRAARIDLRFSDGSDHNLRTIGVVPAPQFGFIDVTFADSGGTTPYSAKIYYARLYDYEIVRVETRFSTSPVVNAIQGSRGSGVAVIRGFRLGFTNGDHHLEHWTVDLCPNIGTPATCNDNQFFIRFRDGNGDDPFDWWLSYTLLR